MFSSLDNISGRVGYSRFYRTSCHDKMFCTKTIQVVVSTCPSTILRLFSGYHPSLFYLFRIIYFLYIHSIYIDVLEALYLYWHYTLTQYKCLKMKIFETHLCLLILFFYSPSSSIWQMEGSNWALFMLFTSFHV